MSETDTSSSPSSVDLQSILKSIEGGFTKNRKPTISEPNIESDPDPHRFDDIKTNIMETETRCDTLMQELDNIRSMIENNLNNALSKHQKDLYKDHSLADMVLKKIKQMRREEDSVASDDEEEDLSDESSYEVTTRLTSLAEHDANDDGDEGENTEDDASVLETEDCSRPPIMRQTSNAITSDSIDMVKGTIHNIIAGVACAVDEGSNNELYPCHGYGGGEPKMALEMRKVMFDEEQPDLGSWSRGYMRPSNKFYSSITLKNDWSQPMFLRHGEYQKIYKPVYGQNMTTIKQVTQLR